MNQPVIVVMGVSGSGKSTVGNELAARMSVAFQEGDSLHPDSNIAKMRSGAPLTDQDRYPWLDRVAAWIDAQLSAGTGGVISCSALKKRYRERIIGRRSGVRLVYLQASKEAIANRLSDRQGHFMPASLLDSQFEALEPPTADERPIIVGVTGSIDNTVQAVLDHLDSR